MDIRVISRGAEVKAVFDKAAERTKSGFAKTILRIANKIGGKIAETVIEVFPRGTGALARSFLPARLLVVQGGYVKAGALSDLVYAGILDEGGVIRPKTAKALAIPLNRQAAKMWPRDLPRKQTFVHDSVIFFKANMKARKGKPMYVLRKSVRITGRHYLAYAIQKYNVDKMREDIGPYLVEEFEGAGGD